MKRLLILVTMLSFFSFTNIVSAEEYIRNVTLKAAFDTNVDTTEIKEVRVILEVVPASGMEPYRYETKLPKDKNYQITLNNQIIVGEVDIEFVMVYPDAGSIYYDVDWEFNKIDEQNYVGQIAVKNKENNTSSTARIDVFEDIALEHIFSEDDRENYVGHVTTTTTTSTTSSTTTTTPPSSSSTGNPDIIIGGEDSTTTTTTTTQITTSEKELEEQKKKEEKEKRAKQEDLILKVMFSIIGIVIAIGLTITIVKIYKANKLI